MWSKSLRQNSGRLKRPLRRQKDRQQYKGGRRETCTGHVRKKRVRDIGESLKLELAVATSHETKQKSWKRSMRQRLPTLRVPQNDSRKLKSMPKHWTNRQKYRELEQSVKDADGSATKRETPDARLHKAFRQIDEMEEQLAVCKIQNWLTMLEMSIRKKKTSLKRKRRNPGSCRTNWKRLKVI